MSAQSQNKSDEADDEVQPIVKKKTEIQSGKFDRESYKSDVKLAWFYKCLIGVVLSFLFAVPFKKVLNDILVEPILQFCANDSYWIDCVLIAFLVYSIRYTILNMSKLLIPTGSSLVTMLGISIIYIGVFRQSGEYEFYHLKLLCLAWISYLDLVILAMMLRLASYKVYSLPINVLERHLSFIEDAPIIATYADLYGNGGYAKKLAAHINATTTVNAFGIGVFASWGSGKTDYLNRLEEDLILNEDNLVFEFNPWRVKSDAIVDEFFKTLSVNLKPFNKSITADLKEYSKRILQTGKEIEYRFLDTLVNNWSDDDTLKKKQEEINSAIKLSGKRIVVLIDDLDRLTGKEVMEVLRIIRNTANFVNTFFIVTLDQDYIVKTLVNTKDFANEKEYLRKIFQLTITLPAFRKKIFVEELERLLITGETRQKEAGILKLVVEKLSSESFNDLKDIFENYIDNVRELKRFCNSFKVAFEILKDEVEISDLFVLELIKNKYLEVYNYVKSREPFDFNAGESIELKDERVISKFFLENGYDVNVNKYAMSAFTFLASSSGKNQRRFSRLRNFHLYFSYQLFDQISFAEFNVLLTKSAEEMIVTINNWSETVKYGELRNLLQEIVPENNNELNKILTVFLNIDKDRVFWLEIVKEKIFTSRVQTVKQYFEEHRNSYKTYLIKFFKDSNIPIHSRSYLLHQFLTLFFLTDEVANYERIFKDKVEIQKIQIQLLKDEFADASSTNDSAMSLLKYIYESIDAKTHIVTIYQPALKLMKDKLLHDNKYFEDYILSFFRPLGIPYLGDIVPEPFFNEIFSDLETFKEKLKGFRFERINEEIYEVLKLEIINKIDHMRPGVPIEIESGHKRIIEKLMIMNDMLDNNEQT
ncbi:KAP family P-loop NTPase fold protein [Pedobacter africanus]|uniref:KAP family P-loop domain-containing protein n=1 Tax=Pedobacter africanus TaxID=151894 RepID=A0A1W1Z6Q5_9SPHI|nr:P-loop NTPase fold protein [Pedobacter africanus]SMC44054.1 KAP family P-loop domain-containing protein [Pedobacter africanus]